MRVLSLLTVLLLAACEGASDDASVGDTDDTDTTGSAADTDGGGGGGGGGGDGGPVLPTQTWETDTLDGSPVVKWTPPNPKALLIVLHGTGGNVALAEQTEMIAILNAFVDRGFAFVLPQSSNRVTGVYDDLTAPATNKDWARLVATRQALIDAGAITDATPVDFLGYSAGGTFAAYAAHAGVDAGWPVNAIDLHNASAASRRFLTPSPLPIVFVTAENDDVFATDLVQKSYQAHHDAGHEDLYLLATEQKLSAASFARSWHLHADVAERYWTVAVDGGWWDASGTRLFPLADWDAQVDAFLADPGVEYDRPARAVCEVVLATHALNGGFADQEAEWMEAQLP